MISTGTEDVGLKDGACSRSCAALGRREISKEDAGVRYPGECPGLIQWFDRRFRLRSLMSACHRPEGSLGEPSLLPMPSNLSKHSTSRVATAIPRLSAKHARSRPCAVHTIPLEGVLQPVKLEIRGILQELAERFCNSLYGNAHNGRSSPVGRGRLRRWR